MAVGTTGAITDPLAASRRPVRRRHLPGRDGDGDLTPRQYAVLVTVSQNEGFSQTHLVEKTGIDRSTLADIVRRMLKKGLLQRRRTKEDARAYAVKLTDEGWQVLKAADPLAKRVDDTHPGGASRRSSASASCRICNPIVEALRQDCSAGRRRTREARRTASRA